ncbi:MAG: hypothetical protein ABSE57_12280 [Bryobacteraceae bacterium]|jgi:hypothetical protein
MNEPNYGQHGNEGPAHDKRPHIVAENARQANEQAARQGASPPYWTRMHRDWRMWVGLVLMLAAITIYVLSEDLAWLPHLQ